MKKNLRTQLLSRIFLLAVIFASLIYFYFASLTLRDKLESQNISYLDYISFSPKSEIFLGNENASITIFVYTGFDCSSCKKFYKEIYPYLVENYIKTGKARYYHKYYVTREDIKKKTLNYNKSLYLYCVEKNDRENFWKTYEKLFIQFPEVYDKIEKCLNQESINFIENENFLFGITSQPTFFIGVQGKDNSIISGTSLSVLKKQIREKEISLGYE